MNLPGSPRYPFLEQAACLGEEVVAAERVAENGPRQDEDFRGEIVAELSTSGLIGVRTLTLPDARHTAGYVISQVVKRSRCLYDTEDFPHIEGLTS